MEEDDNLELPSVPVSSNECKNGTSETQMDLNESTCEKILSSINEECIKISQEGKENGIEGNVDLRKTNGKDDSSIEASTQQSEQNIEDSSVSLKFSKEQSNCNIENNKSNSAEQLTSAKHFHKNNNTNDKISSICKPSSSDNKENNEGSCTSDTLSIASLEDQQPSTNAVNISSGIYSKESSNDSTDKDSDSKDGAGVKIKLRSFASLCSNDTSDPSTKSGLNGPMVNLFSSEISGVSVGDIVQHGNNIESDKSGIMHLKISNVVGGEDCITGLAVEEEKDSMLSMQGSSVTSLIETDPSSLESSVDKTKESNGKEDKALSKSDELPKLEEKNKLDEKSESVVNIFKSPLIVKNTCLHCKKQEICEFRIVIRKNSVKQIMFICSEACKTEALLIELKDKKIQKPRYFFERICAKCGKEIGTCNGSLEQAKIFSWQTREFCNKLCLADYIGEVARSCYGCKKLVRMVHMVKYCVRFGSDVHQFCSNLCLESFKATIKACSFCQKNLTDVKTETSKSSKKQYCGKKCLKRAQRKDISQINYKEESNCTVCNKFTVNIYEYIQNQIPTLLCSDTCLKTFKYVSKVTTVNCCLCARLLNAEESCTYSFTGNQLKVFCSESCFSIFVLSARKIVLCEYCRVKKYNFDMIRCSSFSKEDGYFTCSICCLTYTESYKEGSAKFSISDTVNPDSLSAVVPASLAKVNNQTDTEERFVRECSMCLNYKPAQFHMVMSDSSLRSFCSYNCATKFKCTYGYHVSGGSLNAPEKEVPSLEMSTAVPNNNFLPLPTSEASTPQSKLNTRSLASILQSFNPPMVSNKSTMCRPSSFNKSTQCESSKECESQTQDDTRMDVDTEVSDDITPTEGEKDKTKAKSISGIIPMPIPVYVPTPMMMYSCPTPVPLIIPIPVPIPIFIPTSEKTTKDLEEKIKGIFAKFPCDPAQSHMIQLAEKEANKESVEASTATEPVVSNDSLKPVEEQVTEEVDEDEPDEDKNSDDFPTSSGPTPPHVEGEEWSDAENEFEMINKIEAALPKLSSCMEDNIEPIPISSSESVIEGKRKRSSSEKEDSPSPKRSKDHQDEQLDLTYGVAVWKTWAKRKLAQDSSLDVQEDLMDMDSYILSHSLTLFLQDLEAHDSTISIDTLFYLLLGIQKYIFEQGSTYCIFLEHNFDGLTTAFDNMIAQYAFPKGGDLVLSKQLQGTRVNEEMLWEARQLGAHTPHVLLNTLFYFNTKVFLLKTAEDHFNLKFTDVLKGWNKTKVGPDSAITSTSLLKYSLKTPKEQNPPKYLEMYENKLNPLRCPVKLYEFYISKCPESVRNENSTYYVYPEQSCLPDSPVWFSSMALDNDSIEKMLNRILLVREIQQALFNQVN